MKPSEILSKAADLIEPEGKWCQGAYARDESGEPYPIFNGNASSWCLLGAVRHVANAEGYSTFKYVADAIGADRKFAFTEIQSWNDAPGRSHSQAVSALRHAARLAKHSEAAS